MRGGTMWCLDPNQNPFRSPTVSPERGGTMWCLDQDRTPFRSPTVSPPLHPDPGFSRGVTVRTLNADRK